MPTLKWDQEVVAIFRRRKGLPGRKRKFERWLRGVRGLISDSHSEATAGFKAASAAHPRAICLTLCLPPTQTSLIGPRFGQQSTTLKILAPHICLSAAEVQSVDNGQARCVGR